MLVFPKVNTVYKVKTQPLKYLVSANGSKQTKINSLTSRRKNAIHQIGNVCTDEQLRVEAILDNNAR